MRAFPLCSQGQMGTPLGTNAKYCAGCGRSRVTKTLSLFSRTLLWTDCKADNYNETRDGLKCR